MSADPVYKLQANDKMMHKIATKALRQSEILSNSGVQWKVDASGERFFATGMSSKTLESIIKWCEHHEKEDPMPMEELFVCNERRIPSWDNAFLNKLENATIFNLLHASDHLGVWRLFSYLCKFVTNMTRELNPAELRKLFANTVDVENRAEATADN